MLCASIVFECFRYFVYFYELPLSCGSLTAQCSIPQPDNFPYPSNHLAIIAYTVLCPVCISNISSAYHFNSVSLSSPVAYFPGETAPCLCALLWRCPLLTCQTDTSSASEDEGSLRRQGRLATSTPYQGHGHPAVEHWFNRVIQGSSTSSSASSTSSHPGGRSVTTTTNTAVHAALNANAAAAALADLMAHTQLGQWHTCAVSHYHLSVIQSSFMRFEML